MIHNMMRQSQGDVFCKINRHGIANHRVYIGLSTKEIEFLWERLNIASLLGCKATRLADRGRIVGVSFIAGGEWVYLRLVWS